MKLSENHSSYWRKNLRLTGMLLLIWFVVTFVVSYFARDLSFSFLGWPFSFWMAAQGSPAIYVLLIGYYAHTMNSLDDQFGLTENE